MEKELIPLPACPNRISKINLSELNSDDLRRISAVFVTQDDFYELNSPDPKEGGPLDLRLGAIEGKICPTCRLDVEKCPGHFGSIELVLPVYNIGYLPRTIQVLKCICKSCSNILLPTRDINKRLNSLYNTPPQIIHMREFRLKSLVADVLKYKVCPHCGAINGDLTAKANSIVIQHIDRDEKVKSKEMVVLHDITPLKCLQIFKNIPTRQIPLLIYNTKINDLSGLIIQNFAVPPTCIRPSVVRALEGTDEDDLTVTLKNIIFNNNNLAESYSKTSPKQPSEILTIWRTVQQYVNEFIDSTKGVHDKKKKNKITFGIIQRLKGKQGRFRTNLSGKRVDFSGRTVITPDPNAQLDQVVVPKEMAMVLTFPTKVTKYNIEMLRKMVINGPNVYPGAKNIKIKNYHISLFKEKTRQENAMNLSIGDEVERHLINDDIILFNRQPSLHRISIMGFRAKIMESRTLRFNESACAPFNADFDGDEMNIHVPQTLEAVSDARVLMNIVHNLFSPARGELIVAPTQDFLSGAYLLTRKDVFLDYHHFMQLVTQIFDGKEYIEIPQPAIVYPRQLWTGKQVISLLISPNRNTGIHFTHRVANKEYKKDEEFDPKDGMVHFHDNYMVSGVLEKSIIGGGGKSIWSIMSRDYSPQYAARCMERIAKVAVRFLMNRGFSIGITDVTPDDVLTSKKMEEIKQTYERCYSKISDFDGGTLIPEVGLSPGETLEAFLNKNLSDLRNSIGKICTQQLKNTNTPLVMAKSGAKGSDINICQMMACLGQQSVSGARIIDDFIDRSIPHFQHGSKDPKSKGFVDNSFYTGLTPFEFFFHTMGGREGLVDSSVKTAQTGYMQRRFMKSLEDLVVAYDNTVRISDGTIVQFVYGDDGLDPLVLEKKDFPVDMDRVSKEIAVKHSHCPLLEVDEIDDVLLGIKSELFSRKTIAPDFLQTKLFSFLDSKINAYKAYRDKCDPDVVRSILPITKEYLKEFVDFCYYRCEKAVVDPGTTVGAIAGQSIGEPATQMTLKSFHFAGIASMNVTLGVPRVEEVMNAVKNIKTPLVTAYLERDFDEGEAREVRGRINKVNLNQISRSIQLHKNSKSFFIRIELDLDIIIGGRLPISASTIRDSINAFVKDKRNSGFSRDGRVHVILESETVLRIECPDASESELYFKLQKLMLKLPSVPVSGVPGVNNVYVDQNEQTKSYKLYVTGNSFLKVLNARGIDPKRTISNHVLDVEQILGIEAARSVIISEISNVMDNYGLTINNRHLLLLSDLMTLKGRVLGITRHGLEKFSPSSFKLASFETPSKHLYNAGYHNVEENVDAVTTSIIVGNFCPIGSGMMDILLTDNLIDKATMNPLNEFLTPQPPSEIRRKIESNLYDPRC